MLSVAAITEETTRVGNRLHRMKLQSRALWRGLSSEPAKQRPKHSDGCQRPWLSKRNHSSLSNQLSAFKAVLSVVNVLPVTDLPPGSVKPTEGMIDVSSAAKPVATAL